MTRDDIVALFNRRDDAWARHDARALTSDHAEDATWDSPMQGRIQGRESIHRLYEGWMTAFPDLTFTASDLLIDGDRAVQFFTTTGTQKGQFAGVAPTGRRIEFKGAWLYAFGADGSIAHSRLLYDLTTLLMQLGVLKTKAGN
jgi:steroid delta-isomerase-like uncharacterized protein